MIRKMWRPEGWEVDPCEDCSNWSEDAYGLLCDLACGEASAYANYEAGATAILEALFKMAKESPTGTFIIDSKAEQILCIEGAE